MAHSWHLVTASFASFDASYMLGVYMFKRSKYDLLSTQQTTSERLRLHGEQIVHLKLHSDLIPLFTKSFWIQVCLMTQSLSLYSFSVNHLGLSRRPTAIILLLGGWDIVYQFLSFRGLSLVGIFLLLKFCEL